jgi:CHASE2 domain-containing sensor protein/signal transduction histidine kinase
MKRPEINPTRHIAFREWLLLCVILLSLAAILGYQNGLGRLDQTLYDRLVQTHTRPARNDIIIVGIDDYSLTQLGRWPWARSVHAQMLNRLWKARPRAIGLDLILSEPERADAAGGRPGDAELAKAIGDNHRTVLPIAMQNAGAGLGVGFPIPEFSAAAAELAHINTEIDHDGVVRSVFLKEGQNGQWWPQFATALRDVGENLDGKGGASVRHMPATLADTPTGSASNAWQRDELMHIPYSGGSGHFTSVPFVSVLRGEVPDTFFTDKYVLVGATAVGLGDQYPTPMAGNTSMSGVEIHANILASLLEHASIRVAPAWQVVLFSIVPALLAMLAYMLFSPRVSLAFNALLFVLVIVASNYALRAGVWIAPSAALIALLLTYPLWSWRRLEAAIAYLGLEFTRLDQEPHLLPEAQDTKAPRPIQDLLANRIQAMEKAARRVRDLRHFVSDSLDSLPDATLICTVDGHVLLANRLAVSYFNTLGITLTDALLPYLFNTMRSPQPLDQATPDAFNWWDLIDIQKVQSRPHGIEVRDENDHDLLIKSAACYSAKNKLAGWIVSVVDISVIRSAERSRDETLRFISHDMRAPQSSILALLEMQRDPDMALPLDEFFTRVEKASRKTLDLADNFVQLARAESQEYRYEEADMQDVLNDAVDEMWVQAHAKRIDIVVDIPERELVARMDRPLMTRVLINLISNAIKYSAPDTRVTCALKLQKAIAHPMIVVAVSDQGQGIAQSDQLKLFRRFQRIYNPDQPRQEGVGLGLVFVKTVVERHQGYIGLISKVGEGTTFTITLPIAQG